MKLLHVVASPRGTRSRTLTIANAFLQQLQAKHPELQVQTRDLFAADLPPVDGQNMDSKYRLMVGRPIDPGHAESWAHIEALIAEFLEADIYLVSAPMWNFSIPYVLKYYIDAIVQPRYLFGYDEHGVPVGLVHGKKMVCITTRGGDYSLGTPMNAYDAQESYLRQIFGFVGITDLQCINAQPMDLAPGTRAAALEDATRAACLLADQFADAYSVA
ncbi:FMN-dependent NADH-azoreductase [Jatrophihabitans sp.]|uniref:FMN-dependent NADH-azoreductase n=1 Tax=Jatrophihabitans sp. TaxID=1932789 RepID=UPI002CA3E017|nr:NAD(P)H-dependent oxidoreductase [Jatrophihabitans sp.]